MENTFYKERLIEATIQIQDLTTKNFGLQDQISKIQKNSSHEKVCDDIQKRFSED